MSLGNRRGNPTSPLVYRIVHRQKGTVWSKSGLCPATARVYSLARGTVLVEALKKNETWQA